MPWAVEWGERKAQYYWEPPRHVQTLLLPPSPIAGQGVETGKWKRLHKGQHPALRDTQGAAAWEGSHLLTGSSPNFMSRRIAVGAV